MSDIKELAIQTELDDLKRTIKGLKKENKRLSDLSLDAAAIRKFYFDGLKYKPDLPKWLWKPNKTKFEHGIPMFCQADWHDMEIVYEDQVHGVNKFDHMILEKRVKLVTERCLMFNFDILKGDYPGIFVPYLGDMVSGYIHEELAENSSLRLLPAMYHCADLIIWQLTELKKHFKEVVAIGIVGNHGRLSDKPRSKFGVVDNIDWGIYNLVARHFAKDEKVQIIVPSTFEKDVDIYGRTFLFEHGDRMRGGSGISGPATPWALGEHKLRRKLDSMGKTLECMVFGHWHQRGEGPGYAACPSLKGYDEYANKKGFKITRPASNWLMVHPDNGITMTAPLYGDKTQDAEPNENWWRVGE